MPPMPGVCRAVRDPSLEEPRNVKLQLGRILDEKQPAPGKCPRELRFPLQQFRLRRLQGLALPEMSKG
jgi:hypothetical protein